MNNNAIVLVVDDYMAYEIMHHLLKTFDSPLGNHGNTDKADSSLLGISS